MTTTLMDIVIGCENYLGWQPELNPGDEWKPYVIEVAKLKRAMASGTRAPVKTATVANLALALEFSRRKKLPVKTPLTLLHRIPQALALAHTERAIGGVQMDIEAAILWEKERDDEESLRWIFRLVRSSGEGRQATLDDWKQAGRG